MPTTNNSGHSARGLKQGFGIYSSTSTNVGDSTQLHGSTDDLEVILSRSGGWVPLTERSDGVYRNTAGFHTSVFYFAVKSS